MYRHGVIAQPCVLIEVSSLPQVGPVTTNAGVHTCFTVDDARYCTYTHMHPYFSDSAALTILCVFSTAVML